MNVISDGEGTVTVEQVSEVSCVGDIPLSLTTFALSADVQSRLLAVTTRITAPSLTPSAVAFVQLMAQVVESVGDVMREESEAKAVVEVKKSAKKAAASSDAAPAGGKGMAKRAAAPRAAAPRAMGPVGPPGSSFGALAEPTEDAPPTSDDSAPASNSAKARKAMAAALMEDDDDIDLGNPDDVDKEEDSVDDAPDASVAAIVIGTVRSRCVRVLNALLLNADVVKSFITTCKCDTFPFLASCTVAIAV